MYKWLFENKKEVFRCVKPHSMQLAIVVGVRLLCILISVVMPLLNMRLINLFVYETIEKKHFTFMGIYVLALGLSAVFSFISSVYMRKIDLRMQKTIQEEVMLYSFEKRRTNFNINEMGEIDARIKVDAPTFQQFINNCILNFPFIVVKLISVCFVLWYQSYEIAIIVGLVQVLVLIVQKNLCKPVDKQSVLVRNKYTELNEVLNDIVSKMSYVDAIGAEKYLHSRFTGTYDEYVGQSMEHAKCVSKASVVVDLAMNLNFIIVLGIGSYKIFNGMLQVGALLAIVQYVGTFFSTSSSVSRYLVEMHGDKKKIYNIIEILKSNNVVKEANSINEITNISKVVLEKIFFAYNEENYILRDLSAEFVKGKINCILGPSGSGKTTILKLMLGEYSVQEGKIYMVTESQKIMQLHSRNIGFVPQDNVFFTDTLYNNIVLGKDITFERVCQVCKECSIYEDILGLENGFDTIMSNGINNFSGGQIKRLSIVRAILQDKDVLLIDEPTSGLDSSNAEIVVECIEKYADSKIIIVITHDKCIEERCNQVFQLIDGHLEMKETIRKVI